MTTNYFDENNHISPEINILGSLKQDGKELLESVEPLSRSKPLDRSDFKYTLEEFDYMNKDDQESIATHLLCELPSNQFDDEKLVQCSRSSFRSHCIDLGMRECWRYSSNGIEVLYIHRGVRDDDKCTLTMTVSKETKEIIDSFFDVSEKTVDNLTRSKIFEQILSGAFLEKLKLKESGLLEIRFKREDEERIM